MNKSKSNIHQSRLRAFFFGSYFEFISPLSLEECVTRLKNRSEKGTGLFQFNNRSQLLVKTTRLPDDSCSVYLQRNAGSNLDVQATVNLERWEGQSTLVSGKACLSRNFYMGLGFGSILFLVWFFLGLYRPFDISPLSFAVLALLGIVTLCLFAAVQRDQLVRIVYNTLSDEII